MGMVLFLGCRQLWDSPEPAPPSPEYSISLDYVPAIKVGSTYEVAVKTSIDDVAISRYSWISDDESVLTVTEIPGTSSATIRAISATPKNSTFIRVKTTDSSGKTKESTPIEVQTYTEVETLSISGPAVVGFWPGVTPAPVPLTVEITPDSAKGVDLVWSVDGIALELEANDDVTPIHVGTSKVTVKANDASGQEDSHNVAVISFPTKIPPDSLGVQNPTNQGAVWVERGQDLELPAPASLGAEFDGILSAEAPTWTSADESFVSTATDKPGKIHGAQLTLGPDKPVQVTLANTYNYDNQSHTVTTEYPVYVTKASIGVSSSSRQPSQDPRVITLGGIPTVMVAPGETQSLNIYLDTGVPGLTLNNVTWETSNSDNVMVVDSKKGIIKGIKDSATITAKDKDTNLSAQVFVKVESAGPSSISVENKGGVYALPVKNVLQLTAIVEPADSNVGVRWSVIPKEGVAEISPDGMLSSQNEPRVIAVTATSTDNPNVSGSAKVTIYSLTIDGNTGIDDKGGETTLSARINPLDERTQDIELGDILWTVEAGESIVTHTVNPDNSITIQATPPATRSLGRESSNQNKVKVTASTKSGLSYETFVYINPVNVGSIDIEPPETLPAGSEMDETSRVITVSNGVTFNLGTSVLPANATNAGVDWSITPEGIVSVTGGAVKALAPGVAVVTARSKGAAFGEVIESQYTIKVRDFEIFHPQGYIPFDAEGVVLSGKMIPANAGTLSLGNWKSDTTNVVTVDPDSGVLSPITGGQATITATDDTTKLSSSYILHVVKLQATSEKATIEQGSKTGLAYTFTKGGADIELGTLTWQSDNLSIAKIDTTGETPQVEGVGPGTVNITLSDSATGLSSTIEITVVNKVASSVSINEDITEVPVHSQTTFTATITPEEVTTGGVVWEITEENPEEAGKTVASIDQSGKLSARNPGTVTIMVTTKDSVDADTQITDTLTVTVQSLIADPATIELKVGSAAQELTYKTIPENSTPLAVTAWSGYDEDIVSVNGGVVTAQAAGSTVVIGTNESTGLSARTKIDVWGIDIEGPATLSEGGSATYKLVKKPSNEVITSTTENKISWEISGEDLRYAWVDENGKVTAEEKPVATTRALLATVTLTVDYDGLKETKEIVINGVDATGITIDATPSSVNKGKSVQMTAQVTPEDASDKSVSWSLADGGSKFASIGADTGNLQGIEPGYVTVIATAKGASAGKSVTNSKEIVVYGLHAELPGRIKVNDTFTVGVTVLPTNEAASMKEWKSSDESVATIDEHGNVKALAPGETTITATDEFTGISYKQKIVVYGLKVSGAETVTAGSVVSGYMAELLPNPNSDSLTLGTVSWSSTEGSMESDGTFNVPTTTGEVVITARDTTNGISGFLVVTVTDKKVSGLTITNAQNINVHSSLALNATVEPSFATNKKVEWALFNEDGSDHDGSVATISTDGTVKGVAPGTVKVVATALGSEDPDNPITATETIVVRDFTISLDKNAIFEKETATITASILPSGTAEITWNSSNESVATVNSGAVTGVAKGSTTITATDSVTGMSKSVSVVVSEIVIVGDTTSLIRGESTTLRLMQVPQNEPLTDNITWSVNDPNIAWIDTSGKVTAEVKPETPATRMATREATANSITVTANFITPQGSTLSDEYVININAIFATGIAITPEEAVTVNVQENVQLAATVTPGNASNKGVQWSIDPTQAAIAEVDENGKVTGKSAGQVTVTATAAGTASGNVVKTTKTVTVNDLALTSPQNYVVRGTSFTPVVHILPGESTLATMGDWTGFDDTILSYDSTKKRLTALKGGSTTITATDSVTGLTRSFGVNVAELTITAPSTLEQGSTSSPLAVALIKGNADIELGDVNWVVEPASRATLVTSVEGGKQVFSLKGISPGTVTLTATDSNGISGTKEVEITFVPVTSVTVSGESKVSVNNETTLSASVLPDTATYKNVSWSLKNTDDSDHDGSIATIGSDGTVRGVTPGTVKAIATALGSEDKDNPTVGEFTVIVRDLALAVDSDKIYVKQIAKVDASLLPAGSGDANITDWKSSNEVSGTVSGGPSSATVEGVKAGYITITAIDEETGRSKSTQITIADIEIRAKSSVLTAGGTVQLELYEIPTGTKITEGITWESLDPSIATVDKDSGLVTASTVSTAAGKSAKIVARLVNNEVNLSDDYFVTVDGISVESIVINDPTTINVGPSVNLSATVSPDNASNKKIIWSTSAGKDVALLTSDGQITGEQAGTITVTATAVGGEGVSADKILTIRDFEVTAPDFVTLGNTLTLNSTILPNNEVPSTKDWQSTMHGVATVDSDTGVITPVSGGNTTITVTDTVTGITKKVELHVAEIEITTADSLPQGESADVDFRLVAGNAEVTLGNLNWSATPTGIISIDTSGEKPVIKGLKTGVVTLKATDSNGIVGTKSVEVTKQDVQTISITGGSYVNLGTGKNLQLSADITPATATNQTVKWAVTKQAPVNAGDTVATINQDGVVTGISAGTVEVTATALGASESAPQVATHKVIVRELIIEAPQVVNVTSNPKPFVVRAKYIPEGSGTPKIDPWDVSHEDIVTLSFVKGSSAASLTVKDAGEVYVTAQDSETGMEASVGILIQKLVILGSKEIHEGRTLQLSAQLLPTGEVVTTTSVWGSYNTDRAWVGESTGLVTASPKPEDEPSARLLRNAKTVVISATYKSANGGSLFAEHLLTITDSPAEKVFIDAENFTRTDTLTVPKEATLQLSTEVLPVYTTDKTVTWTVSDETIATITGNGLLTGKATGSVEITATANGVPTGAPKVIATRQVYVTELVFVQTPRDWITKNGNFTSTNLTVVMKPEGVGITPDMDWSGVDTDVITVTEEGKVTAGTIPGTYTIIGKDTVSGQSIKHTISFVDLKINLDDWVAKGQTKPLNVTLLPTDLPEEVKNNISLSLDITAPGSTDNISILSNSASKEFVVKGLTENKEEEKAKIKVLDDTTGLSTEKEITVVALKKKENAKNWVPVKGEIDLGEYVDILPKSSNVTPNMGWEIVTGLTDDEDGVTIVDGSVKAGGSYGRVVLKGTDERTNHVVNYPLYLVDLELRNAPDYLSAVNGKAFIDVAILPTSAGISADPSWELTSGTVITVEENGSVEVAGNGATGVGFIQVTDATTEITLPHKIEVVDFKLTFENLDNANATLLYVAQTAKFEAKLSQQDYTLSSLQWTSEPAGYLGQPSVASDELSAEFLAQAPYDSLEGVTVTALDSATGLSASYTFPVVGVRMKENQPLWVAKGSNSTTLEAEFVPENVVPGEPNFTWEVKEFKDSDGVTVPSSSMGFNTTGSQANVLAGNQAGYATILVTDTTSGLSVEHNMTVVELLIANNDIVDGVYTIPISTNSVSPNSVTFMAQLNPRIKEAPEFSWSVQKPTVGNLPTGTSIPQESVGRVIVGTEYGEANITVLDKTTGLSEKVQLTVVDFVFPENFKPYMSVDRELSIAPRIRPAGATYDFGTLNWTLVKEDGSPSYLAEIDDTPSDTPVWNDEVTINSYSRPGKLVVQAVDRTSGVVATLPLFVAALQTENITDPWAPVTKQSNFRDLQVKLLPEELAGGDNPIIVPEYTWRVLPATDTPDETMYTGKATIVQRDKIWGQSRGRVQVEVSEKRTGLTTIHDMWIVEFLFQGDLPLYLTTGGNMDITTITPVVLPLEAGVEPDVVWTDLTEDFAVFTSSNGAIEGEKPHKKVTVSATDKVTKETAAYDFAVVGFEIVESGPTWIDHNIGTFALPGSLELKHSATLTGRYLPEDLDLGSIGLTPSFKWSGTNSYATVSTEDDGSATVTARGSNPAAPKEQVTGDVMVSITDGTTGLSGEHKVIVGALEIIGTTQVRTNEGTIIEVIRYPLEYGQLTDSKWVAGNSNITLGFPSAGELGSIVKVTGVNFGAPVDVTQYDPTNASAGVMIDPKVLNAYDSNRADEKWALPKNQVVAHDENTGLLAQHGVGVGADYMEIEVSARSINIPVSNTNILVDWYNSDGLYTKGGSEVTHPGGVVRITELGNTINLTDWHYTRNNGRNMQRALLDVRKWGHADFTGAREAFRDYDELKTFSATDGPILGGNLSSMFQDTNIFDGLGLQYWDVSKVTHMYRMFRNADGLIGLYQGENEEGAIVTKNVFTGWDVRQVTTTEDMFRSTAIYTGNHMSDLNWESLTNPTRMFYDADGLIGRNMNNWTFTSKVRSGSQFQGFFQNSEQYTGEGSSNWTIDALRNYDLNQMFSGTSFVGKNVKNWHIKTTSTQSIRYVFYYMFNGRENSITGEGMSGWTIDTPATSARTAFSGFTRLTGVGMSDWTFPNVVDAHGLLYNRDSMTGEGMTGWSLPKATNGERLFYNSDNFKGDISGWNMPLLESGYEMFSGTKFDGTGLETWNDNFKNLTNGRNMFSGVTAFTGEGISGLKFPALTNGNNMFSGSGFTGKNAKNWTFGKIGATGATSMENLFNGTESSLTGEGMSGWEFTTATSAERAFENHSALTGKDMSGWKFPKLTNGYAMFNNADALVGDGMSDWDFPELTRAEYMFANSASFKGDYLYSWKFPKLENAFGLVYQCDVLDPDISQWNMPSLKDATGIFHNSPKFTGRGLDTEEGVAQWNKNLANVTIAPRLFLGTAFTGENVSGLSFPNLTSGANMFNDSGFTGKNAKNWTFGKIGAAGASSLEQLFNGTESSLTGEGMSGWSFPNATSSADAFNGHTVLTGKGMAAWELPKVSTFTNMFNNTSSFNGPVETWNMGQRGAQVTDADGNGITDDDGNPIYYQAFSGTNVSNMFNGGAINRDLSSWDFSGATNTTNAFNGTPMAGDASKHPVGFLPQGQKCWMWQYLPSHLIKVSQRFTWLGRYILLCNRFMFVIQRLAHKNLYLCYENIAQQLYLQYVQYESADMLLE